MTPPLRTVEVAPAGEVLASIVLLHGLGADGHDFEPIAGEVGLDGLRWILPHAPVRPVTLNGGYRMPAWYDILGLDRHSAEDEAGIRDSAAAVQALLQREFERGVPAERIVVAGFSQGGALALFTGLRAPQRLGGVAALSTYLPLPSKLPEAHPANAAVPVFMAHGTLDDIVPHALGAGSRDVLRDRGYDVEWHEYPVSHGVCAEEVADLRAWLARVLSLPVRPA